MPRKREELHYTGSTVHATSTDQCFTKQEIVADERTSAHPLTLLAVSGGEAGRNGLVRQALRLWVVEDGGVRVQTFRHPITDQVNQTLKDNVHIDVVLRRCLEKSNS